MNSGMDAPSRPGFGLHEEEVKRRHFLGRALVIGLVAGLISSGFREALQWPGMHHMSLAS
jgi:hypothetical protein